MADFFFKWHLSLTLVYIHVVKLCISDSTYPGHYTNIKCSQFFLFSVAPENYNMTVGSTREFECYVNTTLPPKWTAKPKMPQVIYDRDITPNLNGSGVWRVSVIVQATKCDVPIYRLSCYHPKCTEDIMVINLRILGRWIGTVFPKVCFYLICLYILFRMSKRY